MTLSLRPTSMPAAVLRLAASLLAVLLCVQGLVAAAALGTGPLHRHRAIAVQALAHSHPHEEAERHYHAPAEPSVEPVGHEAADAGAAHAALAWACVLMAAAIGWRMREGLRHARPTAPPWAVTMIVSALPRRPPRG